MMTNNCVFIFNKINSGIIGLFKSQNYMFTTPFSPVIFSGIIIRILLFGEWKKES